MAGKKVAKVPKSRYQDIEEKHGELGIFVTGELRSLIKAGISAFDFIRDLQTRVAKLEAGQSVTIVLTLGNGGQVSYTCPASDMERVDSLISKWMEKMLVIFAKQAPPTPESGESHTHDEPEGYS